MRFAILGLLAVTACKPAQDPDDAERDQLRTRASFELGCPGDQLKIVTIDDRTKGVTGCGKKAVYVEQCEKRSMGAEDCTWLNNTGRARSED